MLGLKQQSNKDTIMKQNKKRYQKPTIKVYDLPNSARLLGGSPYEGGNAYIPALDPTDENKLA